MQHEDFYTPVELEIKGLVDSIESNTLILKLKGIKLEDNLQYLIKSVSVALMSIEDMAKKRMQDAIEKEERLNKPRLVECMDCNKQFMAVRTGTAMNNGYECNTYYCEDCDSEWIDYMPVDENDILKWQLNFITQAEKLRKQKKLNISLAKLKQVKIGYQKMLEAQNDVLEKDAAALQANNEAQKALLLFKVGLQAIATKMNEYIKQQIPNC